MTPRDMPVTPKQRQCLQMVADGVELEEIAKKLGNSPSTVRVHLAMVLYRLGVHTRAAAVARGLREGWLE